MTAYTPETEMYNDELVTANVQETGKDYGLYNYKVYFVKKCLILQIVNFNAH